MSTDLQKQENVSVETIIASKGYAVKHEIELANEPVRNYLPRLQFLGDNSELVKLGKQPIGFVLFKNKDPIRLGDSVNIYPITKRKKAVDFSDKKNIRVSFDPESEIYQDIVDKCESTPKGTLSKALYGDEFLVWVPEHGFALYFMYGPTARNEARAMSPILINNGFATLKWQVIQTKSGYIYKSPLILEYSGSMELPTEQSVLTERDKFVQQTQVKSYVTQDESEDPGSRVR